MRRIKFGVTVLKMSILVSYKQERVFSSRELKNHLKSLPLTTMRQKISSELAL